MNRPLTALFAALEALLVVGIGIGIPLVPLTVMWAAQYGLQIDWVVFWRASVDIWLAGSGADVMLTLDPVTAAAVGFTGAATPFVLTIAPLGFALLTVLLGVRAGRRVAETPYRLLGVLASVGTFGGLALLVTLTALHPFARPSIWQGTLMPTLVFALGVGIGSELTRRRPGAESDDAAGPPRNWFRSRVRVWTSPWSPQVRAVIALAMRGGAAVAVAVFAAASLLVAGLILAGYAQIIALYESVHGGVLGGIALTAGQLAFLPNFVIWTASWLVGPGFAIGTGSAVTPLGTSLGPLPAVPVLGALPTGDLAFGFLGLLVPVLAGFVIGIALRPRVVHALGEAPGMPWLLATGAGTGIAAGLVLGLLAWFSAGAAGPGRLVDVGPNPWPVGLYAALEVGVAAAIGLLAASRRSPG